MRKVTFGGANSLDNYLARKDHAVDWLLWSDEASSVMADYWKTIDTVLMGRKTYEVALRHGNGSAGYPGMKTHMFSRTLKGESDGNVTIVSEDAPAFVRDLKIQEGKDICLMGGGELAKPLFEADVIDEIGFNIHPVLLGSGIPVFHPNEPPNRLGTIGVQNLQKRVRARYVPCEALSRPNAACTRPPQKRGGG